MLSNIFPILPSGQKLVGGRQTVPVSNANKKSSWLNTAWASPLSRNYPSRTRLALNQSSPANPSVFAPGNNQAADPRNLAAALYDLNTNVTQFGNSSVLGGSNINNNFNQQFPTSFLIILAGLVLLYIWK